jgi:hypothetical protein
VVAVTALAATALGSCEIEDRTPQMTRSTLRATIVDADGDGRLERGPGEPFVERTDLARRGRVDREVARFAHLTDTHVRDEESPARVPVLDRLGGPVAGTFRPHEALSTHVLTAALRALNLERPQAVLITGDLLDSAQRNELEQLSAVLNGGPVDPNSGAPAYRGVQSADNPDAAFYRPDVDEPRLQNLLRRAQRTYFSPGLRAPWYPAIGDHDVLVQGVVPPSAATDALATGRRAVLRADGRLARTLGALRPRGGAGPDDAGAARAAVARLLRPGARGADTVPADARRRHLRSAELVEQLRRAARLDPRAGTRGHLDYSADIGPGVRAIVLDTAPRRGGSRGVLTRSQVAFLARELRRAGDRAIVVASHHGLHRTAGAARARALLARDDRVVAEIAGDTHRNEIRPVRTRAGGYWRITTSSLADWPQQGRMLRLVTGPDGSRALETWMVDHAGGLGLTDLPAVARSLAYLDARDGGLLGLRGRPADRNARLWLPPRR